jgi:hypothetical protein
LWINGELGLNRDSPVRGYQSFALPPAAMKALRTGQNRLALHTPIFSAGSRSDRPYAGQAESEPL